MCSIYISTVCLSYRISNMPSDEERFFVIMPSNIKKIENIQTCKLSTTWVSLPFFRPFINSELAKLFNRCLAVITWAISFRMKSIRFRSAFSTSGSNSNNKLACSDDDLVVCNLRCSCKKRPICRKLCDVSCNLLEILEENFENGSTGKFKTKFQISTS